VLTCYLILILFLSELGLFFLVDFFAFSRMQHIKVRILSLCVSINFFVCVWLMRKYGKFMEKFKIWSEF
jgi:hypothetical protein